MTRGSANLRTDFPKAIGSSSDIARKRSRSFWSCVSLDSKAIYDRSMPAPRQRIGALV
jgi:hypothetical protein